MSKNLKRVVIFLFLAVLALGLLLLANLTGKRVDVKEDLVVNEVLDKELANISAHPDLTLTGEENLETGGVVLSFNTKRSINEMYEWYLNEISKNGWTLDSTTNPNLKTDTYLKANKNGLILNVSIINENIDEPTTIVLEILPEGTNASQTIEGPGVDDNPMNYESVRN
ncbi:hypothetical protein A2715_00020 [Candidatus Woesebacteria bacterium RIFCSPHIGHO2_01_FULL_39_32]|uniref:Uncharacterized protein n=1 Tax=Candidatus Woesebacteria bacterium RIFCSPLOWO2_01_FULL_39_25 TaxID=1802521 RepID=A0A1F8BJP0_9BACT|nr:MAG: hypothetical protein A2715_00020 [Candidatus Woesebacteria bacterium RIFCSPHIGHO2_01_FULL_39_32]OGM35715.1 MAG: hypothetical protein A3F01_06025 [Candidatus Woesebacteria bacterium RIFCSPHIGHO2_12_FULL_38_11]OGM64286.1 MAG: hypothetical protein A2893_02610 [Candidatus Woesebacteria bacterium RIFCSPLOWO2_01_FULL_39_25]